MKFVSEKPVGDITAACHLSISSLFEGKVVSASTLTDVDGPGDVVVHIKRLFQGLNVRPNPKALPPALFAVLRLEFSGLWRHLAAASSRRTVA